MKPADVHIWEKFVRAYPESFSSVDYDVAVGPAPAWLDVENDERAAKESKLYRRKVDVVGYHPDFIALIEVKPFAESKALGQALSYDKLYRDDHPQSRRVVPWVVTNSAQNGYEAIFERLGVHLVEVGVCERCKHYPSI